VIKESALRLLAEKHFAEIEGKICLAYSSDIVFQLRVIYKSYRQVLTPVNNSQFLLKLQILDKLKLVTLHEMATQRK
jgi:hypothetical protein